MKPTSTSTAGIWTPISTTKGACFTPRERLASAVASRRWARRANSCESARCSVAIRSPRIASSGSAAPPLAAAAPKARFSRCARARGRLVAWPRARRRRSRCRARRRAPRRSRGSRRRGRRPRAFAICVRSSSATKWSASRVITTRRPCASRRFASRRATSSTRSFSSRPCGPFAPWSSPPWPASTTTVSKRPRPAASSARPPQETQTLRERAPRATAGAGAIALSPRRKLSERKRFWQASRPRVSCRDGAPVAVQAGAGSGSRRSRSTPRSRRARRREAALRGGHGAPGRRQRVLRRDRARPRGGRRHHRTRLLGRRAGAHARGEVRAGTREAARERGEPPPRGAGQALLRAGRDAARRLRDLRARPRADAACARCRSARAPATRWASACASSACRPPCPHDRGRRVRPRDEGRRRPARGGARRAGRPARLGRRAGAAPSRGRRDRAPPGAVAERGRRDSIGVGPIDGVRAALAKPLEGGLGRAFAAFGAGGATGPPGAAARKAADAARAACGRAGRRRGGRRRGARRPVALEDGTEEGPLLGRAGALSTELRLAIDYPAADAVVGGRRGRFRRGPRARAPRRVPPLRRDARARHLRLDARGLGRRRERERRGRRGPRVRDLPAPRTPATRSWPPRWLRPSGCSRASIRAARASASSPSRATPCRPPGGSAIGGSGRPDALTEQPLTTEYGSVKKALHHVLERGPDGLTNMTEGLRAGGAGAERLSRRRLAARPRQREGRALLHRRAADPALRRRRGGDEHPLGAARRRPGAPRGRRHPLLRDRARGARRARGRGRDGAHHRGPLHARAQCPATWSR